MTWVQHGPAGAGKPNILASHSLNPDALDAHVQLYRVIMFGPSGLSRAEREAIAVVVSAVNECHSRLSALLGYAIKLTGEPARMVEDDVRDLRGHGLSDRDIVDANQVVSYYNYVNRVADGLGVELENGAR